MGVINWQNELLTPAQIMEMSKTEKGRKEVGLYILRARVAYGMQCVFEAIGAELSAEQQQACCQMMWDSLAPDRVPIENIMAYCKMIAETMNKSSFDCVGNA